MDANEVILDLRIRLVKLEQERDLSHAENERLAALLKTYKERQAADGAVVQLALERYAEFLQRELPLSHKDYYIKLLKKFREEGTPT